MNHLGDVKSCKLLNTLVLTGGRVYLDLCRHLLFVLFEKGLDIQVCLSYELCCIILYVIENSIL